MHLMSLSTMMPQHFGYAELKVVGDKEDGRVHWGE
jgi:hypothetical protein